MLFICLCVAGFLAGYRAGYPDGYASGEAKRKSEQPYPKVYDVGDLIRETGNNGLQIGNQLDFQPLIDATQTSVFPDEWEALGGPCTMAPLPWRETLVVNATSGVHDRLQTFFGDLSSVRLAVAAARKEQEAMQQARDAWIKTMLEPASTSIGKELTLIDADIDLIGSWDVRRNTPDETAVSARYTFVDADTVRVPAPDDARKSMETWYFVSPGSVVVSGKAYIAATTREKVLVLIPNNDPQQFLVATQAAGEP